MTLFTTSRSLTYSRPFIEMWCSWSLMFGVNYFATPELRLLGLHVGPLGLLVGWPHYVAKAPKSEAQRVAEFMKENGYD